MRFIIFILLLFTGLQLVGQPKPAGKPPLDFKSGLFSFNRSIDSAHRLIINYKTRRPENVKSGYRIEKELVKNDSVFFRFLTFKDKNSKVKYNQSTFYMLDTLNFNAVVDSLKLYCWYKGASIGMYTVPFRLRWSKHEDKFDFESSLSLSSNLIIGIGKKRSKNSWLDASIGIGLSGANLDSLNSYVTENRTAMAFSVNLGLVVKPARYANIGVFVGKDFLGNRDRRVDWVYNKKTWLGLGINITFNEIKSGAEVAVNKQ